MGKYSGTGLKMHVYFYVEKDVDKIYIFVLILPTKIVQKAFVFDKRFKAQVSILLDPSMLLVSFNSIAPCFHLAQND